MNRSEIKTIAIAFADGKDIEYYNKKDAMLAGAKLWLDVDYAHQLNFEANVYRLKTVWEAVDGSKFDSRAEMFAHNQRLKNAAMEKLNLTHRVDNVLGPWWFSDDAECYYCRLTEVEAELLTMVHNIDFKSKKTFKCGQRVLVFIDGEGDIDVDDYDELLKKLTAIAEVE